MNQWFAMNGYAFYVWSAYGLVVLVLILNVFVAKWQKKKIGKTLRNWFKRQVS